jgi:hypothetical protein
MRALAKRLRIHAAALDSDPARQLDLPMASELMEHLARLTAMLAKPPTDMLHWAPPVARPMQRSAGDPVARLPTS